MAPPAARPPPSPHSTYFHLPDYLLCYAAACASATPDSSQQTASGRHRPCPAEAHVQCSAESPSRARPALRSPISSLLTVREQRRYSAAARRSAGTRFHRRRAAGTRAAKVGQSCCAQQCSLPAEPRHGEAATSSTPLPCRELCPPVEKGGPADGHRSGSLPAGQVARSGRRRR